MSAMIYNDEIKYDDGTNIGTILDKMNDAVTEENSKRLDAFIYSFILILFFDSSSSSSSAFIPYR